MTASGEFLGTAQDRVGRVRFPFRVHHCLIMQSKDWHVAGSLPGYCAQWPVLGESTGTTSVGIGTGVGIGTRVAIGTGVGIGTAVHALYRA